MSKILDNIGPIGYVFSMTGIFDMDKRDLKKLQRFMKESPKEFRAATAGVLNSLAFGTRKNDIQNLNRMFIVRNKRFVEGSIRVEKARRGPIAKQMAITGSVRRPRFSGWTEQEYGRPTKRTKQHTTTGRGGSRRKQVSARYRMKPGRKYIRAENISPKISRYKSPQHRTVIFLNMMRRRKREPFYITHPIGGMKRGLYEFKSGRLLLIASTENIRQPKRRQWRTQSIRQLTMSNDMKKIWQDNINRIIARRR